MHPIHATARSWEEVVSLPSYPAAEPGKARSSSNSAPVRVPAARPTAMFLSITIIWSNRPLSGWPGRGFRARRTRAAGHQTPCKAVFLYMRRIFPFSSDATRKKRPAPQPSVGCMGRAALGSHRAYSFKRPRCRCSRRRRPGQGKANR